VKQNKFVKLVHLVGFIVKKSGRNVWTGNRPVSSRLPTTQAHK